MRVAISGAHCCGKSTLIDEFLVRHSDYVHEPEAYELLVSVHGETFAAEPSLDDYFRQLEFQGDRLRQYAAGDRVIFERSPADYLAYMLALGDLGRDTSDDRLVEHALDLTMSAITLLDVIVFLSVNGGSDGVPDAEDLDLRRAVNARLEGILIDDDHGLFTEDRPSVLEAEGTTAQRLRILESAMR